MKIYSSIEQIKNETAEKLLEDFREHWKRITQQEREIKLLNDQIQLMADIISNGLARRESGNNRY